jgi:hypothetical protein
MWVQWTCTLLLLAVAGHCLARLVAATRSHCAGDRTHNAVDAVMSIGMAAMISPIGGPIPRAGWETAFAVAITWSAVATITSARAGQSVRAWAWLRQVAAGGGMLYMLAATSMPMSGTDTMHIAYFAVIAIWSLLPAAGLQLTGGGLAMAGGPSIRTAPLGPRAISLCEAAMSGGMVVMLLVMH